MLITYATRTGNVKRFVGKLRMDSCLIDENPVVDQPFILITYTTGFGQVPAKVRKFLERNHPYLIGVAASGNRNWGSSFAGSADVIATQYGVPIVSKFEMAGMAQDVTSFTERANTLWQTGTLN